MNTTIEWQDSDGANAVALLGTTDGVNNYSVNGQAQVQVRTALRLSAAKPTNRGNLVNRVSFAVTYAPAASALAAQQAVATKTAALLGAMVTHCLLEGVFSTFTWQLADAALESYEFLTHGLTVYGRFSFIGGAYTGETPS